MCIFIHLYPFQIAISRQQGAQGVTGICGEWKNALYLHMVMNATQPLISVIVPCYNVEPYLERCFASIAGQSYGHLEMILVDDGSTDGTGAMCDRLAATDSRARVVHKANGGLSDARNAGIDVARGELLAFVDSDDHMPPHAIATLLGVMQATGADIAEGRQMRFDEGGDCQVRQEDGHVTTYTAHEAIDDVLYQHTLSCSACSHLYKASLFDGLRYPKGMLYEDLAVAYDLLTKASTVAHTSAVIYCYMRRRGSITGHYIPKRTDVLNILDRLLERVEAESPRHIGAVQSRRLSAHFNLLRIAPVHSAECRPLVDRCWRVIRQLRWQCLTDKRVRLKNKAGILLSYTGLKMTLRCINRY